MPQDVSAGHFDWLVEGRSRNQRSTLDLYRMILENEAQLAENVDLQAAAQEVAGIAFSLWRAVFLSDTAGDVQSRWADVKTFLVSLIADNTVLYVTDKNARNWSFRYYLDNATFRLGRLADTDPGLLDGVDLTRAAALDKDEWMNAQAALERVLPNLRSAAAAVQAPA